MSDQFIEQVRERIPQALSDSGRRLLIQDGDFLSEVERHLDLRPTLILIRNLSATPNLPIRSHLRRFLLALISAHDPTDLHFQILCNLTQGFPDHARLVFARLVFGQFYHRFAAARLLLFACVRADDSCLQSFIERDDLVDLAMDVSGDDVECALLTVRLLLERSRLDRLLSLSTPQMLFTLEVLQTCLGRGAEICAFVSGVLESWRARFGPDLLAQGPVPEAELDLLYSALSLASEAVLIPGAIIDIRLAPLALDLLAACGRGDGPKPTRIGRDDQVAVTPRSMKVVAVRLLANLAGRDERSRRRIGEDDALTLLLNQTKIDDCNPFIREWVVVAIRYLTENDAAVQQRIAELQPTSFQTLPVQM